MSWPSVENWHNIQANMCDALLEGEVFCLSLCLQATSPTIDAKYPVTSQSYYLSHKGPVYCVQNISTLRPALGVINDPTGLIGQSKGMETTQSIHVQISDDFKEGYI